MYNVGFVVFGPSLPNKFNILTLNSVNSQSSMNSHKFSNAKSRDSGTK